MEEDRPQPLVRRLIAEAIGTFMLTFMAVVADAAEAATTGSVTHTARYLAPGLVLVALIFALSGVSGAHFNPAVTVGFALRRVFPWRDALPYVAAQCIGAIIAGYTVVLIAGRIATAHGVPEPVVAAAPAIPFATEVVLTALLLFVIIGTSDQKPVVGKNAAIAVGFTVAACGLAASTFSGASMNPARALGPLVATLHTDDWPALLLAPLVGTAVAVACAYAVYGAPNGGEKRAARPE